MQIIAAFSKIRNGSVKKGSKIFNPPIAFTACTLSYMQSKKHVFSYIKALGCHLSDELCNIMHNSVGKSALVRTE